jgi:predicted nucleotide-binding protein
VLCFKRYLRIFHEGFSLHDAGLKNELARFLEKLRLQPVILHEQPDEGRTIFAKLRAELADVGFAFALLTPDDLGSAATSPKAKRSRARQNVVFEHGMLAGRLGPERVCAVVRGDLEFPSDLTGVLYKRLGETESLDTIALELIKELKRAGYEVDANIL